MSTTNVRPIASVNQRRSQRILLSVSLSISGKRANKSEFTERASTLVVNAHGGLILLNEPVMVGQVLTIKNILTTEEIACTVVDINVGGNGISEVGVEFAQPCPRFWRVSFPPVDWTPRSVEAKRLTQTKPPTTPAAASAPPPAKK